MNSKIHPAVLFYSWFYDSCISSGRFTVGKLDSVQGKQEQWSGRS